MTAFFWRHLLTSFVAAALIVAAISLWVPAVEQLRAGHSSHVGAQLLAVAVLIAAAGSMLGLGRVVDRRLASRAAELAPALVRCARGHSRWDRW